MKHILLTTIVLGLLSGCTNQESSKNNESSVLKAGVGVLTGSGDFGQLGPKDSKIVTLKITNSGDASMQGPPQLENSNFSIVYQNGCEVIAPKKSCTIKLSFSAVGKTGPILLGSLAVEDFIIPLRAEILDPKTNQTPSVSFSVSPLDFGTITDNQSSVKNLTITNNGSIEVESDLTIGPSFSITYENCRNKVIPQGKSCQVKISLNGTGKSGAVNEILSFAGQNLVVTGQVVPSSGPSVLGGPDIKLLINNTPISSSYSLGDIKEKETKQVIVVAKNMGNKKSEVGTAQLLSGASGFALIYSQCRNIALAPGASCQMRITASASSRPLGNITDTLSFLGQSLILSADIISAAPPVFQNIVLNQVDGLLIRVQNKDTQQIVHSLDRPTSSDISLLVPPGSYEVLISGNKGADQYVRLPQANLYSSSSSYINPICRVLDYDARIGGEVGYGCDFTASSSEYPKLQLDLTGRFGSGYNFILESDILDETSVLPNNYQYNGLYLRNLVSVGSNLYYNPVVVKDGNGLQLNKYAEFRTNDPNQLFSAFDDLLVGTFLELEIPTFAVDSNMTGVYYNLRVVGFENSEKLNTAGLTVSASNYTPMGAVSMFNIEYTKGAGNRLHLLKLQTEANPPPGGGGDCGSTVLHEGESYYVICNDADFALLEGSYDNFILGADLNNPTGVTYFHGKLDGNGYSIGALDATNSQSGAPFEGGLIDNLFGGTVKNLTVYSISNTFTGGLGSGGLIGRMNGATVSNINLENVYVYGDRFAGGLAARIDSSTVENINISFGEVYAQRAGGLSFDVYMSTVSNVTIQGVNVNYYMSFPSSGYYPAIFYDDLSFILNIQFY